MSSIRRKLKGKKPPEGWEMIEEVRVQAWSSVQLVLSGSSSSAPVALVVKLISDGYRGFLWVGRSMHCGCPGTRASCSHYCTPVLPFKRQHLVQTGKHH
jgi:hypothetical protein